MRRRVVSSVVLALLVLSAGCLGIGGGPERSAAAEDTLADVTAAIQEIDTYRAETDLSATAVSDGETLSRSAAITGRVNVTQRRSKTTLRMDGDNRSVYRDNRTVYRECGGPWGWANESVAVDKAWINETTLARHAELLGSGDLRLRTTEQLTAENAVALVGHPTQEQLQEYRAADTQPAIGGAGIENATIRLVVDNRTHRPRRASMSFETSQDGVSAFVSMQTTFGAYGDPVRISIPAAVTEDATEWSGGCPGS